MTKTEMGNRIHDLVQRLKVCRTAVNTAADLVALPSLPTDLRGISRDIECLAVAMANAQRDHALRERLRLSDRA